MSSATTGAAAVMAAVRKTEASRVFMCLSLCGVESLCGRSILSLSRTGKAKLSRLSDGGLSRRLLRLRSIIRRTFRNDAGVGDVGHRPGLEVAALVNQVQAHLLEHAGQAHGVGVLSTRNMRHAQHLVAAEAHDAQAEAVVLGVGTGNAAVGLKGV